MIRHPTLEDGWLKVPYHGPELARTHIGLGPNEQSAEWRPAYLDLFAKVAQCRPPATLVVPVGVWLRVDDQATFVGRLTSA